MSTLPPPTGNALSSLSFSLSATPGKFAPRLGRVILKRGQLGPINIETPNFIAAASRGIVRHLSKDHLDLVKGIQWVHIPFESFLEHTPPVPTLHSGAMPLHTFLGYTPSRHVVSMSIRDPSDIQDMPTNGNDHVAARCVRGVRKVTPNDWHRFVTACEPDLVVALSDIPTKPPFSQKRVTKSIYRSTAWLSDFLRPPPAGKERPNVLVHMAGGIIPAARTAFAQSLTEDLHENEAKKVFPLQRLDDGVTGYVFNLVPLQQAILLAPESVMAAKKTVETKELVPLLEASLNPLSPDKLRLVHTAASPHEILTLVQTVGIDLFDSQWAQKAADVGVALDFQFPAPAYPDSPSSPITRQLGHNLYDGIYSRDFSKLADAFQDGLSAMNDSSGNKLPPVCHCGACSPQSPPSHISHSAVDEQSYMGYVPMQLVPPYARAYLHHLLHTHEMSAHALLALHNFEVLDAFFAGIRNSLKCGTDAFNQDVYQFVNFYDEGVQLFDDAGRNCVDVDLARGKGRLTREAVETTVKLEP